MNKKGSILPVTIISMLIMMILGLTVLKMFYSQNIADTYLLTKKRVDYAAEGALEMARGYIAKQITAHLDPVRGDYGSLGEGFLFNKTGNKGKWDLIADPGFPLNTKDPFDKRMYPNIKIKEVYCMHVSSFSVDITRGYIDLRYYATESGYYGGAWHDIDINGYSNYRNRDYMKKGNSGRSYKIVAVAYAEYKTMLSNVTIYSTMTYLFCSHRNNTNYDSSNPTKIPYYTHDEYFILWRPEN